MCAEPEQLIAFLTSAFDGTLERRVDRPDGSLRHAEVRIDDGIVMLGGGASDFGTSPAHLHLYVPDANVAFERAIAAGASEVRRPEQAEGDSDLRGGVEYPPGIVWWLATERRDR
ncbi:MAG: VOC family protein [Gordonia sp. (in: high G+C Gram-positive bacteria)]|uniref:VOC family protein n=1 Tax=Gordonia sp. (in: high G+C Gram-positive bacteria) TaxID=84139 RepID=UPI0039E4D299